jgi:hypothetical protein
MYMIGAIIMGLGLFGIGLGLLSLFAKDILWSWYEFWYRVGDGIRAERTAGWDTRQTVGGVACLILGIVLIVYGYSVTQRPGLPTFDLNQIRATATATAQ